ncbi:MAG: hypothetical protein ACK4YM_09545 [Novosphingobium sp.]
MLKHFAAATVAITSLLALFAGGDDVGVAAQIEARQARNQLVAAEQQKLGTSKVSNNLKVKRAPAGSFGADETDASVNNGSGSVSAGSAAPRRGDAPSDPLHAYVPPERLPAKAGESVTFTGVPGILDPSRATPAQASAKAARKRATRPSEEDLARMRNASRQRSAASAPAD